MDIPIELFITFIASSIGLAFFGFIRQPQIPAMLFFAGLFIMPFVIMTDNIIMDYFNNGSTDAINYYDVESSTGQVLINSVTAHSRGERLSNTSSELEGDTIDCITVFLGRSGSPPVTSLIQIGVMDTSTNFITIFGSMNVTQLLTSSTTPYQFCLPVGQTYTFTDTETVGIKYNAGDGSNTLTSRIDANNPFDGSNTQHVHATGSSWISNTGEDMMMIMTLRGSSGITTHADFEFTELPKTMFALLGVIFMLSGALMVFKAGNE